MGHRIGGLAVPNRQAPPMPPSTRLAAMENGRFPGANGTKSPVPTHRTDGDAPSGTGV
jgi:hypothetical protein